MRPIQETIMQDFDFDGFFEDPDTLDDGMDQDDEYADGFSVFDPDLQTTD
jgi:hypothetical protein